MPNDFQPFPSIEEVVRELLLRELDDAFTDGTQIGVEYPADLASRLPYAAIERIGGPRTRLNDYPLLDVEVFASSRTQAESLSERIDALLLGYPHSVMVGTRHVAIDSVTPLTTPRRIPWDDANVRRFGATYQFSVRR